MRGKLIGDIQGEPIGEGDMMVQRLQSTGTNIDEELEGVQLRLFSGSNPIDDDNDEETDNIKQSSRIRRAAKFNDDDDDDDDDDDEDDDDDDDDDADEYDDEVSE